MTKQRKRITRIPARSLKRIQLSKGIFSRVARQLDVEVSAVTRVANGERSSKKITAALVAELQRIETELEESESAA